MSFHKRRAEFVAMPHIATYRISGTPLISIVYPRWNVRTILPVIYLLATQTVLIWHATSTRNRCRAIPVARVTERPCKAKCPEEALDLTWLLASGPAYLFVYVVLFFDVCYFFDVSFHKRRAEFVAMPHIATYRISGRPLIPIVYSSCFLLLQEPQTAQTARPRSSSVEKRRLYYFHLNYPTTGL